MLARSLLVGLGSASAYTMAPSRMVGSVHAQPRAAVAQLPTWNQRSSPAAHFRMQVQQDIKPEDIYDEFMGLDESGASVKLKIVRNNGANGDVTVQVRTQGDSTVEGKVYAPIDTLVTLTSGQVETIIEVPIINDDEEFEANEQFTVTLTNPGGGAVIEEKKSTTKVRALTRRAHLPAPAAPPAAQPDPHPPHTRPHRCSSPTTTRRRRT